MGSCLSNLKRHYLPFSFLALTKLWYLFGWPFIFLHIVLMISSSFDSSFSMHLEVTSSANLSPWQPPEKDIEVLHSIPCHQCDTEFVFSFYFFPKCKEDPLLFFISPLTTVTGTQEALTSFKSVDWVFTDSFLMPGYVWDGQVSMALLLL